MKKSIIFLLVALLVCMTCAMPALASETNPDPYDSDTSLDNLLGVEGGGATVEDVKEYVDTKSGSILSLLQHAAEPILVIAFILFAFMAVLGIFGNGSLVGRGIFGMAMSGIAYTLVLYSADIMHFIAYFFAP